MALRSSTGIFFKGKAVRKDGKQGGNAKPGVQHGYHLVNREPSGLANRGKLLDGAEQNCIGRIPITLDLPLRRGRHGAAPHHNYERGTNRFPHGKCCRTGGVLDWASPTQPSLRRSQSSLEPEIESSLLIDLIAHL
jgi:hypothetical protein